MNPSKRNVECTDCNTKVDADKVVCLPCNEKAQNDAYESGYEDGITEGEKNGEKKGYDEEEDDED